MKLVTLLSYRAAVVAAGLLAFTGAMLTYEVVARYFFIRPTIWAAELSQLSLIWGCMLAMAYLLHIRRHITVNAITNRLSPNIKRFCVSLSFGLVAVFSSLVTLWGWVIFADSFERGRTTGSLLNLPTWVAELAIPVGFFLLTLQAIIEIINYQEVDASLEPRPE
ncbi:MAG: TRAP transporter small permease [Aestuariivita sp.]|nr:TRAP transporter small permease [Aestuariivita sp.]MCY4203070.1 TRAP transporter small permease [Aestuariivita sp.]